MTRVFRFDRAPIAERTRLPGTGGIRVSSELTRTGVFSYTDAAGKVTREWRSPEEVAKCVDSIDDVPVTIGHPATHAVTGETFSRLSVGHARSAKFDEASGIVRGVIVANRKDAVDGLASGKLAETSMGYSCRLDATPGVTPEGLAYDVVQRDIVNNHVAVLPAGQARLGTRVDSSQDTVLRLDSVGNQIAPPGADETHGEVRMKIKIKRADGAEVEVDAGSAEHISHLEAARDAATARADAADVSLKSYRDAETKAARAELEATAVKVCGKDFKADGKSDREVREAVIGKRLPAIKCDGKDDVYVGAMFDAALAVSAPAAPAAPKLSQEKIVQALVSKVDSEDEETFRKDAKEKADKVAHAWEKN